MTYYHGGIAGLRKGDTLKPPSVTRSKALLEYAEELGLDASHMRADRVFITTDQAIAALFAIGGWIYAVEPIGSVEPDPDWLGEPGVSVQCRSAVVLKGRPLTANEHRLAVDCLAGVLGA